MTTARTDDTTQLPWAQTETEAPTKAHGATEAPATTEIETTAYAAQPTSAPALNPPTWTGRKTAIAAALAIGFSSMGAVAAAAALPAGTTQGGGQFQQGGFTPGGGQRPGIGQQGGAGTMPQAPRGSAQVPGGQLQQAPADPNASTT